MAERNCRIRHETEEPHCAGEERGAASAGQFNLTLSGLTGQAYNVEASPDLVNWTVIGTVTLDATGSLNFTDTNAASFPQRFYRTAQVP